MLLTGIYESYKQKRQTAVLCEMLSFVRFVKSELQYRSADMESLGACAVLQGFKYIKYADNSFFIADNRDEKLKEKFDSFIKRVGTTDSEGQISLCNEYIDKFSEDYQEHKQNEKNKIQVNTALSIFGALCILILLG